MQSRKYDTNNNPVYTTADNQIEFSVSKKSSLGGLRRSNVSFNYGLSQADQNQEVMNAIAASTVSSTDEVVAARSLSYKK